MASATGRFENCDHGGKDTEVSLAIGVHVPHTPSPLVRWVPPLQLGAPSPKGQLSWSGVLPAQRGAVLLGRHKHDA